MSSGVSRLIVWYKCTDASEDAASSIIVIIIGGSTVPPAIRGRDSWIGFAHITGRHVPEGNSLHIHLSQNLGQPFAHVVSATRFVWMFDLFRDVQVTAGRQDGFGFVEVVLIQATLNAIN
jgi:hypothetical protein